MLKSARNQQKDPEGRMPLAAHLRELRNRLLKSVLAILVVTVVAMWQYDPIAHFITGPTIAAVGCPKGGASAGGQPHPCAEIVANGFIAPFTIMLKLSLTVGLVAASPLWLYQLWAFLAPGLHKHEKKYALSFVAAGAPLFLGGAYLAYAVLPTTAGALVGLTPSDWSNLFPADDFFDIVTRMVLVFGLSFELPLLLVLLNFGGVLTGKRVLSWWRFMVLGITIFAAVATPTGDPLTMSLLAAPIVLLYFGAVGICLFNDRRRRLANPDRELDDDEASELDLTPTDIEAIEPVAPTRMLPEQADGDGAQDGRRGYDDVT
ncbi:MULTISPECIES: twin-arginine translocase subunit TatC [Streptomyces]|uniref:Sec-independent protein translocase protein TatC n=1 Tax=Streptomyces yunnanensis TaxID=156453 RepID=A0ABY8AIN7_9ACTN|nr:MULTISPECIES: twin-arginine translocase subunit TatC [Streptomyces]AJC59592.1 putative sec-independent protein translocase protein TatC [Streptomyces sp. 769]WEB43496.1 twin-arginine translocase subunit TatC [Streptomyces yunnanensis]